jgi:hypothetical protein
MKKLGRCIVLIVHGYASSAQELGVRFGNVLNNNVAVDGVFRVGKFSRCMLTCHSVMGWSRSTLGFSLQATRRRRRLIGMQA